MWVYLPSSHVRGFRKWIAVGQIICLLLPKRPCTHKVPFPFFLVFNLDILLLVVSFLYRKSDNTNIALEQEAGGCSTAFISFRDCSDCEALCSAKRCRVTLCEVLYQSSRRKKSITKGQVRSFEVCSRRYLRRVFVLCFNVLLIHQHHKHLITLSHNQPPTFCA